MLLRETQSWIRRSAGSPSGFEDACYSNELFTVELDQLTQHLLRQLQPFQRYQRPMQMNRALQCGVDCRRRLLRGTLRRLR